MKELICLCLLSISAMMLNEPVMFRASLGSEMSLKSQSDKLKQDRFGRRIKVTAES